MRGRRKVKPDPLPSKRRHGVQSRHQRHLAAHLASRLAGYSPGNGFKRPGSQNLRNN